MNDEKLAKALSYLEKGIDEYLCELNIDPDFVMISSNKIEGKKNIELIFHVEYKQ